MKINQLMITSILLTMVLASCTNKAWYEGAQEGARNNCRSQPQSEVEACMEKLNKKTYEEYEKESAGQK